VKLKQLLNEQVLNEAKSNSTYLKFLTWGITYRADMKDVPNLVYLVRVKKGQPIGILMYDESTDHQEKPFNMEAWFSKKDCERIGSSVEEFDKWLKKNGAVKRSKLPKRPPSIRSWYD